MTSAQPTHSDTRNKSSYGTSPCYWELVAVIVAGATHVSTELLLSASAARFSNVGIALGFGLYLAWRVWTTPGVLRTWGMRRDNFRSSVEPHLEFAAIGAIALIGIAAISGTMTLPATFWIAIFLYPIYGVVQQFALQNLIVRNLENAFSNPIWLAITAAALFGLSHFPRMELVALTLIAGFFLRRSIVASQTCGPLALPMVYLEHWHFISYLEKIQEPTYCSI